MTKSPKYPLPAADVSDKTEQQRRIDRPAPADLYFAPSFKFRHEVRESMESSEAAHHRAYPKFAPRPLSPRLARRAAIQVQYENGNHDPSNTSEPNIGDAE
jgi:hypothetical protein